MGDRPNSGRRVATDDNSSVPPPFFEQDRLAALRGYAILDTAAEQDFDDLAELAAAVCDAPVASLPEPLVVLHLRV